MRVNVVQCAATLVVTLIVIACYGLIVLTTLETDANHLNDMSVRSTLHPLLHPGPHQSDQHGSISSNPGTTGPAKTSLDTSTNRQLPPTYAINKAPTRDSPTRHVAAGRYSGPAPPAFSPPRTEQQLQFEASEPLTPLPAFNPKVHVIDPDYSEVSALILATQDRKELVTVLENFDRLLPVGVPIQIVHTPVNRKESETLKRTVEANKRRDVVLTEIDSKWEKLNRDTHSILVGRPMIWEAAVREKVIMFETDSVLCDTPTYPLKYFLKYDYVGAPWARGDCGFGDDSFPHSSRLARWPICVGNSGLAIISRKMMLKLAALFPDYSGGPGIDMFVSMNGQMHTGAYFPDEYEARFFSVETQYDGTYTPVGTHKPFLYHGHELLSKLYAGCPDMEKVWSLSGVGEKATYTMSKLRRPK